MINSMDSKSVAVSSLKVEHEPSTCIFYESLNGTTPNEIVNDNRMTWHFNEICLSGEFEAGFMFATTL